jgi:hypothetical protein
MAYDDQHRLLFVEFQNGAVYEYENVEPDEALGVIFDGSSQGKAFNSRIKNGGYSFRRLDSEEAATLGA